jgi:molybdopterin-guanine dinucleotide biosynthesis protein A
MATASASGSSGRLLPALIVATSEVTLPNRHSGESSPLRVRGCVLAGGAGGRLGMPKATALLAGRPLVAHPLAALSEAGVEPVVVAKPETDLPDLGVGVLREPIATLHPLAGIVTALRELRAPVLVCACDMPFVSADLARAIAGIDGPLVVPRAGGHVHPLFARYEPALLDDLQRALDDERPLRDVIAELDARLVEEDELARFGDPERLLTNVNTPEELASAERDWRFIGG